MAGAKSKLPIIAAIAAALGAVFFWRKKKSKQSEFFQS
ncbi:MAG: LPXTG cell wall anchor domain-containing protein [Thermoleophilia bacterium]